VVVVNGVNDGWEVAVCTGAKRPSRTVSEQSALRADDAATTREAQSVGEDAAVAVAVRLRSPLDPAAASYAVRAGKSEDGMKLATAGPMGKPSVRR
jgi:hypothetical protein